jgi:hypothetical protein
MSYKVKALDDGRFTITHPVVTFGGAGWVFMTEREAAEMVRFMIDEAIMSSRAEAAFDSYEREYCDE